mmetsp:Transcript_50983/g.143514  ORF Transcript_50983/g.143514 Transcript_50983/m.143514 type:complete len:208 (+) Transcript_50983:421-1044(+)
MSALVPYFLPLHISGGRWVGVPMAVRASACVSSRIRAMPKSPIFTPVVSSLRKMFWALMSRCRMFFAWMYCSAQQHSEKIVTASSSVKWRLLGRRWSMAAWRSPPFAYSITMCSVSRSMKASWYATMLTCDNDRSTSTSRMVWLSAAACSDPRLTSLTTCSSCAAPHASESPALLQTSVAVPYEPSPRILTRSNCSIRRAPPSPALY